MKISKVEPSQSINSNSQVKSGVHMIAPDGPGPQVQVHVSSRNQGWESQCDCTEISGPKPPTPKFLELVAQVSPSYRHELVKPHGTCDGPHSCREHRRVPSVDLETMSQHGITFGRTHVGTTYAEMWDQERQWMNGLPKRMPTAARPNT